MGVLAIGDADRGRLAYLDHHPAGYSLLAQCGGRDITQAFDASHGPSWAAIDTGDARHTVVEVGRLVPAQTAVRRDQVALDGFVFALADLDGDARWAGRAFESGEWPATGAGPLFEWLYDRRGDRAVAKYEGGTAEVTPVSGEELAAHNATQSPPHGDFAWVAADDGGRYVVYNISGT